MSERISTTGQGGARLAIAAAALAFVSGCSAAAAPRRMAPYPAQGQSETQRASDMSECQTWADTEAAATIQDDDTSQTIGGLLSGAALGAVTGAATFGAAGGWGPGAGVGAAVGATAGAISGAVTTAVGGAVADRQVVESGWRNCMVARGYVIEGGTAPVITNDVGTFGGAVGALNTLR